MENTKKMKKKNFRRYGNTHVNQTYFFRNFDQSVLKVVSPTAINGYKISADQSKDGVSLKKTRWPPDMYISILFI